MSCHVRALLHGAVVSGMQLTRTDCSQDIGIHWRQSCSRDTSALSTIAMLCVKLCYINSLSFVMSLNQHIKQWQ